MFRGTILSNRGDLSHCAEWRPINNAITYVTSARIYQNQNKSRCIYSMRHLPAEWFLKRCDFWLKKCPSIYMNEFKRPKFTGIWRHILAIKCWTNTETFPIYAHRRNQIPNITRIVRTNVLQNGHMIASWNYSLRQHMKSLSQLFHNQWEILWQHSTV